MKIDNDRFFYDGGDPMVKGPLPLELEEVEKVWLSGDKIKAKELSNAYYKSHPDEEKFYQICTEIKFLSDQPELLLRIIKELDPEGKITGEAGNEPIPNHHHCFSSNNCRNISVDGI